MAETHDIRLAGPWQLNLPTEAAPERVQLPYKSQQNGPVALCRRFHRPTGLSDRCRVHLLLHVAGTPEAVLLNQGALEFDVQTGHSAEPDLWISENVVEKLQPYNELQLSSLPAERAFTLQAAVLRIVAAPPKSGTESSKPD